MTNNIDQKVIEEKLKEICRKELGINPANIKSNSLFVEDLGIDSFGAIELVFALEEEFKIDIPEADLKDAKSVKDILEYLNSRLIKTNQT
jgi:acyl carrier protein